MYTTWHRSSHIPHVFFHQTRDRQLELEDALREGKSFNDEMQDTLQRLSEIDGALITSKPVGGLPETAKEQLDKFMVWSYLIDVY